MLVDYGQEAVKMSNEHRKLLVTGGAGFIGSHFVESAILKGYDVSVFDNLSSGRLENLSLCEANEHFRFVKGDIRHVNDVSDAVRSVDSVVHLAALVSVPESLERPRLTALTNSLGTLNLLDACVKRGVRRFVFASSCAVYGDPLHLPVSEDHPTVPLSLYAASKLAGEAYCDAFRASFGLETVCLRFFNVYGPRQREGPYAGVIVKFVERLLLEEAPTIFGDGSQTRDFVYVADVVDAVLSALDSESAVGEKINVGSGREVTVNELAEILAKIAGGMRKPVYENRREGEIFRSLADITKAQRLLSYSPKISLREGLARLVKATVA